MNVIRHDFQLLNSYVISGCCFENELFHLACQVLSCKYLIAVFGAPDQVIVTVVNITLRVYSRLVSYQPLQISPYLLALSFRPYKKRALNHLLCYNYSIESR